jgi:glycerol-3-phosphate acyltransferase PlsY
MTDILLILGGYLFGSISTAIVVCRLMGLPDPRGVGSGNPGATNVLRLGGKKAAFLTLVGDMLKGLVPRSRPAPHWRPFSVTCTRCSSVSRAARVWPPHWACSSACTGWPGWR